MTQKVVCQSTMWTRAVCAYMCVPLSCLCSCCELFSDSFTVTLDVACLFRAQCLLTCHCLRTDLWPDIVSMHACDLALSQHTLKISSKAVAQIVLYSGVLLLLFLVTSHQNNNCFKPQPSPSIEQDQLIMGPYTPHNNSTATVLYCLQLTMCYVLCCSHS